MISINWTVHKTINFTKDQMENLARNCYRAYVIERFPSLYRAIVTVINDLFDTNHPDAPAEARAALIREVGETLDGMDELPEIYGEG